MTQRTNPPWGIVMYIVNHIMIRHIVVKPQNMKDKEKHKNSERKSGFLGKNNNSSNIKKWYRPETLKNMFNGYLKITVKKKSKCTFFEAVTKSTENNILRGFIWEYKIKIQKSIAF